MSDIEKVEELLKMLIKELPHMQNGYDIIEKLVKSIDHTIELSIFKKKLIDSYTEFENWLNGLFQLEPVQDEIIAFNFGLFESEDGIQQANGIRKMRIGQQIMIIFLKIDILK